MNLIAKPSELLKRGDRNSSHCDVPLLARGLRACISGATAVAPTKRVAIEEKIRRLLFKYEHEPRRLAGNDLVGYKAIRCS